MVQNFEGHTCVIAVSSISNEANMYVMGQPFMRSYAFSLDYSSGQISLASSSLAPSKFTKPADDTSMNAWLVTLIVLVVIGVVACGLYAIYKFYYKKRNIGDR